VLVVWHKHLELLMLSGKLAPLYHIRMKLRSCPSFFRGVKDKMVTNQGLVTVEWM